MPSETHYVSLPTSDRGDRGEGSSRHTSATSSPLQSATVLGGADQPYELSEKSEWSLVGTPVYAEGGQEGGKRRRRRGLMGTVQGVKTGVLVFVCVLLALVVLLRDDTSASSSSTHTASSTPAAAAVEPPAYRLEDDMVLITKVGSATVHRRLLIHLAEQPLSSLYIPHTLYVSDYPLTLSNITFYDALANVTSTVASLDEFRSLRAELEALMQSNQNLDDTSSSDAGWKLDKYKFLPAVAEAWRRFPNKKWYVIVEADTFLFWNQLVKWLATFDAEEQYMFGHPSFCDYDSKSTMFTHGGSGIVLSGGLVEASFGQDAEFEHNHDELIQASAFGDALLSKAIYDAPLVNLTELSPAGGDKFNSDPPRVLKFTRGNWCTPIMSFHHITPADAAHLYDFQRRIEPHLAPDDMVRWGDAWDEFIPNFLKDRMDQLGRWDREAQLAHDSFEPGEVGVIGWQAIEDWDSETTDVVTDSAEECRSRCRSDSSCMMWQWRQVKGHPEQDWGQQRRDEQVWGKCRYTSEFLRIGLIKPNVEDGVTTGWMASRIDKWRTEQECSGRTGLNAYA